MIKVIHHSALILAFVTVVASVQTANELPTLSITSQATGLSPGKKAIVRLVVKNSGKNIEKGHSETRFLFSKHKDHTKYCVRQDCFITTDLGDIGERIKAGKSLETDIDLADLHWQDAILSGRDYSKPKNLFTEIPAGEYYLSFEFYNHEDATKLSPDNITISSNKILVRIDSK